MIPKCFLSVLIYIVKENYNVALWSSGMILALGARGPEFDSPLGPFLLLIHITRNKQMKRTSLLVFHEYGSLFHCHMERINFSIY